MLRSAVGVRMQHHDWNNINQLKALVNDDISTLGYGLLTAQGKEEAVVSQDHV